jgi:HSP20 family protein
MTLIKIKNPDNHLPSFNNFFRDFMYGDLIAKDTFKSVPSANISETSSDFKVEIAAPGLNKEDFKVEIENGVLKITAEKKDEKKDENSRFTRKEFSYSAFTRSFNMPEQVATDLISASYENGILLITLPKKEEAKQKPVRAITIS